MKKKLTKKDLPTLKKGIKFFERIQPKAQKFTRLRIGVEAYSKKSGILSVMLDGNPHVFKSGSKGFHGQTKFENHTTGERYQINVTAVLIGSKPKSKVAKKK